MPVMPRMPLYGHENSMLMFPVRMIFNRIDRVSSRAAVDPGWNDVFDEKSRDQDGTEHVLYFSDDRVLAQFLPLSVTDHANLQIPLINGNDVSFKDRWVLSKLDLAANSLIDGATGRPLIQQGDRVMRLLDRDDDHLLEDFGHVELVVKQIHQRVPNSDSFFVIFLEDVSKGSNILS